MKYFLLLIPVFTTLVGIIIYKFQDRKMEIFKLDLVQFIYMFLITPTLFVWLKSFLFYILRHELDFRLDVTDLFVIDTIFSVFAILIMGAIAMHSLTKTFKIKRQFDPDFDLYHLSEYFHLWWTHIVIWGGLMLLGTFVSISNVLVPLEVVVTNKTQFYGLLVVGTVFGFVTFLALWISDALQGNFMRLMKLFLAFFVLIHIVVYFVLDPVFNMSMAGYWFMLFNFVSATIIASFFERYEQKSKIQKIREFFIHRGWGENVDLFGSKK